MRQLYEIDGSLEPLTLWLPSISQVSAQGGPHTEGGPPLVVVADVEALVLEVGTAVVGSSLVVSSSVDDDEADDEVDDEADVPSVAPPRGREVQATMAIMSAAALEVRANIKEPSGSVTSRS